MDPPRHHSSQANPFHLNQQTGYISTRCKPWLIAAWKSTWSFKPTRAKDSQSPKPHTQHPISTSNPKLRICPSQYCRSVASIPPNLESKSGATLPHFWAEVLPTFELKLTLNFGPFPSSREKVFLRMYVDRKIEKSKNWEGKFC